MFDITFWMYQFVIIIFIQKKNIPRLLSVTQYPFTNFYSFPFICEVWDPFVGMHFFMYDCLIKLLTIEIVGLDIKSNQCHIECN